MSSRSEIERIRNSLVITAEVLAAQIVLDVVQASPIKLAHLAIRLPAVITRLRRLIIACEAMLDRIVSTENRLIAGMALDIGISTGLVINPPVQVSDGRQLGKTVAPRTLAEIAERLMHLDNRGTPTIRIERYANAAIVYLPGTRTGSLGWTDNPMDMKTNLQAMSGRVSNVQLGLQKALMASGVSSTERVMLVGHSQGGLVAVTAAEHAKKGTFPFNVEKVITFGSPVGTKFPELLPNVLSVENKNDLVPKLDLKANPSSPKWLTLEGEVPGDPISTHRMGAYRQISEEMDGTENAADFAKFASGQATVTNYDLSQGLDTRR